MDPCTTTATSLELASTSCSPNKSFRPRCVSNSGMACSCTWHLQFQIQTQTIAVAPCTFNFFGSRFSFMYIEGLEAGASSSRERFSKTLNSNLKTGKMYHASTSVIPLLSASNSSWNLCNSWSSFRKYLVYSQSTYIRAIAMQETPNDKIRPQKSHFSHHLSTRP